MGSPVRLVVNANNDNDCRRSFATNIISSIDGINFKALTALIRMYVAYEGICDTNMTNERPFSDGIASKTISDELQSGLH